MSGGKTPRKEWIWIDPAPKSTSPSTMNVLVAHVIDLTSSPRYVCTDIGIYNVHLFNLFIWQYLWSTYHIPGTILSAGEAAWTKLMKIPAYNLTRRDDVK